MHDHISAARAGSTAHQIAGDLSALSGFFELSCHDPATAPQGAWRELSELLDPAGFAVRVSATRAALAVAAGCEPTEISARVAVSVTHLGLVARILSPTLAAAARSGVLLGMDANRLRWQPMLGAPVPLSISAQTPLEYYSSITAMATAIERQVLTGPVAAITTAAARLSVSQAVLWGNVASAINGAGTLLDRLLPGAHPAGALLSSARLDGAQLSSALLGGALLGGRHNGQSGPAFRRRSCCLLYRLSPPPSRQVCGDCILAARPGP